MKEVASKDFPEVTPRETELGITRETVELYHYKSNVYQKLSDAMRYAEIDTARDVPDMEPPGHASES